MGIEVSVTQKQRTMAYNGQTKEKEWIDQQITIKVTRSENTEAAMVDAYCEATEGFYVGSVGATKRRKAKGDGGGKKAPASRKDDFEDMDP